MKDGLGTDSRETNWKAIVIVQGEDLGAQSSSSRYEKEGIA